MLIPMKNCLNCHKIFAPRIYPGGSPKKYCSNKCRWHAANIRHPRHPKYPKKIKRTPLWLLGGFVIGLLTITLSISPQPAPKPQIIIQTVNVPVYKTVIAPILIPVIIQTDPPVYARKTSEDGLKFIAFYEGFSNSAYPDALGNCTVGYGHKIRDGACQKGDWPLYVSNNGGWILLKDDVSKVDFQIYKAEWNLKPWEWDFLSSVAFNMGWPNFIKTGIPDLINSGEIDLVPDRIRAANCCVSGLIPRREKEALLFETGIYSSP